jgi:hypothetical protein
MRLPHGWPASSPRSCRAAARWATGRCSRPRPLTASALPGRAAAGPAKTRGERLEEQLSAARQNFETANAAYRSALRQATGVGGAFDPRSSEAEQAEALRQPMISARSDLTRARLTVAAHRLRPPEAPHGADALAAVRMPRNRKVAITEFYRLS